MSPIREQNRRLALRGLGLALRSRFFWGVVAERCRVLAQDPATLRRHTLFHWWPRTRDSA